MELQLEAIGQRVSAVELGYTATIRMGSPTAFELQIEGKLTFRTPNGILLGAPPNDYAGLSSELRSIIDSSVVRADASEVDGLIMEFDSGAAIIVPIDEKYESWGIVGSNGYRVISTPGGEFAIWSSREGT
ncbi:DUF6188 family protein [Nocardia sp. NPDC058633]|uniref:DUF6188 family protein n=1 Tax=Nocardia sp. NPDC058633 TaxID=3346568 RepID=UPI00364FD999